jgi:Cu/Ag efflux pump CusA
MRAIIDWSLRFRLVVLGLAVALIVAAAIQLPHAPVATLPEFGPPYVEIQTEALGLSAEEVEELITVPLEADLLHGVAFLDQIHSQSIPGLSSIVLYFDPGTDLYRARQVVAERLTQAHALPNVSKPPAMLQPLSSSSRVLMVGLSSKDLSLIDMSVLARWTIRPRLLSVPGVANVAIWGQRERQLQVLVDPARLRERGVSLAEVIETAGNALWVSPLTFLDASTPGTGGFIDTPNQRLGIQHILPIRSPDDLAEVAVVQDRPLPNAPQLRLGDVATIVEDHQPIIGDAIVDDGPGLVLVVEKFPGANTLQVTTDVQAALDAMRPGLTGIEVDTSLFRPADYLHSAIDNVALGLIVGLLLIVLCLGLVLRRWRAALTALVAVPLSLAAAALVLMGLGVDFNAFTIGGFVLATGILVDDVVAGFGAAEGRVEGWGSDIADRPARARILGSIAARRGPLVYATLIVGCLLVPPLFATGATGAFVPQLILAFALAALASFAVALIVTTALSAVIPGSGDAQGRGRALPRRLRETYERTLERAVDRVRPLAAAAAVAAIVGVATFGLILPRIAASPVPAFQDRDLLLRWDAIPGTSAVEMDRIVSLAGSELRAVPGVETVAGQIGRAILSDQVVGVDSGEIWLGLAPDADYDATIAAVRSVVAGYPGFRKEIETYASARVAAVTPPAQTDLTVRVYGQDLDTLATQADAVREAVLAVDGVAGADVAGQSSEPTLKIEADLAAADAVGLKPGDIRRAATTLLSGIQVGSLFEEQKVFEVVVWGIPQLRENLSAIRDLPIDTPSGRQVRLGDVASVTVGASPTVIRREGVFRYADVAVTVDGSDRTAVANRIDRAIKAMAMPLEYRAEVLGGFADELAAQGRMIVAAIAVAVAILLLLQAAFQSWRLAAMAWFALLVSMAGGAVAATAAGDAPSVGAALGLIGVAAIGARWITSLVIDTQALEREPGVDRRTAVLHAAAGRLAPLLATTLATALAVSPFLLLGERPGYELIRPMAVVLLGGLLTTVATSLFIVPAMYLRVAPWPDADTSREPVSDQPILTPTTA